MERQLKKGEGGETEECCGRGEGKGQIVWMHFAPRLPLFSLSLGSAYSFSIGVSLSLPGSQCRVPLLGDTFPEFPG